MDYHLLMEEALKEAQKGLAKGEIPVGAVLCGQTGDIVARTFNCPIALNDPTAHAEILALRKAGEHYRNYRLTGTTLVVTMEPCPMCMGALLNARIARLVFGAFDPKAGAAGSVFDLATDRRLNHRIEVIPGIHEEACRAIIQGFFRSRRTGSEFLFKP